MLTVSHLLGMLQEDPDSQKAIEDLREALASNDRARLGNEPLHLIAAARQQHLARGESWAAAQLLEMEVEHAAGDPDRQAQLSGDLGRLYREELLDDEAAKAAFERAVALRPGDETLQEALEGLSSAEANWKDITKRFVDEAESSSDAALKTSLLVSAATFVWKYKKRGRDKDTDRLFKQALESDPGDARAARLYEVVLRKREKWDELAAVLLEAAEKCKSRDERVAFYLRAARVLARKLDQKERAAACYERVLDFSPGHSEGMTFLVEFFTAKEQWDHLVALYDDALRSRQKLDSEQGILLQIGMVHWRFRSSPAEAEPYFARLRKVDPMHPGMLAFYRDYLPTIGDHAKLLTILTDAQRVATDGKLKLELAVELARAAQASGASDRAIDAWKAVQRLDSGNAEALPALRALYRATEKWNSLIEILKGEVDALGADAKDQKLALLREMVAIYRDHLHLDVMVINTWNAILALAEGDAEALSSLAATYERMGRWNDLINVLTRQAEAAGDVGDQIALYMRVARLWIERFANHNQATRPLELVVEKDPTNREALALLKDIYTKKRAWKQLFDVQRAEAELASDPEARHQLRIELARVAGERLHRHADAIQIWKDVLAHEGTHAEAAEQLEKLAEREKDFGTLAEVLERRIGGIADEKERIKLLTKLGVLYGEQLSDPVRAAGAWKRVLALDPKNGRAMRTLRESFVAAQDWDGLEQLYGEAKDWEGLAEVLGNAADRSEDKALKTTLSFRAASVYEQRIGEPHRAFRSYERVLAVDPTNERAARALVPIYERDEKWSRLPALYEVLLATASREDKLATLDRLRRLAQERLNDPEAAFRYTAQAYGLAPDDEALRTTLEAAAERANAWERVVELYSARVAAADEAEKTWLRRRIAGIAGEKLGKVDRAVSELREILAADPTDTAAIEALDRIYRAAGRTDELRALFEHRATHAADDAERWMVLSEHAKLEETQLRAPDRAAALYRKALEIDASDRDALEALDRLATSAERWDELAEVLPKRRDLAGSDEERLELTLRLGDVLTDRKGDHPSALGAFGTVLSARSADARAIAGVERVASRDASLTRDAQRLLEPAYEAAGEFAKLRALVGARLASAEGEDKRALRLRFAELSVAHAGDPAAAYDVLETAFLDDPKDEDLWDRLAAAADAAGKHEQLATAFATAIEATELPTGQLVALASRVANLYDDVLARPADAEPFHRRVIQGEPLDERAFLALKELYTNAERWDELQVLYRNRIAQTVDAEAKLDLLLQVCFLFEELIDDPALAIRAYQDVIDLEPGHAASLRALDRLYTRTERWRDLVALLEGELSTASGDDAVALHQRLGELHEAKLREPGKATDHFESALQSQPEHEGARLALERLLAEPSQRQRAAAILEPIHEMRGAWADLARVLEVQLEAVNELGPRVALLVRIAEIHRDKLQDLGAAFSAFARAVEADPSEAGTRAELARIAAARGSERERAEVLERAVEASASSPSLGAELLAELATLYDDQLSDLDRAETAYTKLVDVASDDPERVLWASRALERIHLGRGDHAKLAADLRRQAKLENDPDARKQLLVRLGDLLEEVLGDVDGAIAVHGERLDLDPSDGDALRALQRLYERRGEWQKLIGVLSSLDGIAANDEERRPLARRVGAIYEEKLDDRENAIVAYNEVLSRFGPDRETLAALTRLYEQAEKWSDLLEVVGMVRDLLPGAVEKAQLRFHQAELQRLRTGDLDGAIEGYNEVLEVTPDHEGALAALAEIAKSPESHGRLAAARALRPRFEAKADWAALLGVLEVIAASDDPSEKLGALRRAAEVADVGLSDAGRSFELTSLAVRASLGESDLGALLADAERLAAASDKWLDYAALLEEVAPDIGDGELQIATFLKIAQVEETRLTDVASARRWYQRILDAQPDHAEALDALERITQEAGDWPALLEVLRRKADGASGAARVQLLLRQAELCESKLDDVRSAIDALDTLLGEADPPDAYKALERLYTKAERWSDLAALYERMLEKRTGFAVENRYRLGRLYRERLNDPYAALEQFKEGLAIGAPHEPTIEQLEQMMTSGETEHRAASAAILEPIYLARLHWPKVEAALEARLTGETDTEARKALLSRLGQLHEDYLEDLDGAMEAYGRLFREDPRDESSWDTLSRLAKVLERWSRLADIYGGVVEEQGVDDATMAKLAITAAQLYDQRANDPAKAASLYRKALAFAPNDEPALAALESVYTRTSDWDHLLELLREQADVADSDARRVELLEKRAVVLAERKADADAAIAAYREVLDVDSSHAKAVEALDALLTQRERWADLAEHLRHRVELARGTKTENELKYRLARILADKQDDKHGAVDLLEEIASSDPSHTQAVSALEQMVTDPDHQIRIIQILEPIYQATDQWKKRIAIHEAQIGLTDDSVERVRLLSEVARLHEERGRDRGLAFDALARAFALEPSNEEVRGEVDRLGAMIGDWNVLVASYERAISASTDPVATTSLLNTVARLHDEKRGDPRAAIETYERLLQHDPEEGSPLDALEALHTMVGDWRGMVKVLDRKVDRAMDPAERGELLRRAGSVLEDLLGDRSSAVGYYRRAVDEDPDDAVALESLDRLYAESSDHAALAEVLRRRVELEQDPDLRVEIGLRLAQLADEVLRQPEEAIQAYQRVLEDQPGESTAILALARLYERQAMWPELLENLRLQAGAAAEAGARVSLLHRAAEVLERELDDVPESLATYQQALEIDPRHEPTLAALLRIARLEDHRAPAVEILQPLLRAQGRWDDVAQLLELSAEAASDPLEKRDHLRALAEVHERSRGDLTAAFEAQRRALAEDPGDAQIADDLERIAAALPGTAGGGAWDRAADALAARASSASDPEAARSLYARVARIAEERLGDDARAIEAHRRALEQAGDDEAALAALDRLYAKTSAWRELGEVLERRVQQANDPTQRAELLVRLGGLRWEQFDDRQGAFEAFEEVLSRDPSDPRALGAVEGLLADEDLVGRVVEVLDQAYRSTGATAKTAGLYEVRIRIADGDGERVRLLGELAQLLESELGDPAQALAAQVRAFELDPRDESLAIELERLATISNGWSSLSGLVERVVVGDEVDRTTRRDLLVRAASWYRDRLSDDARAEAALRAAIEADREAEAAHAQLVELLRAPGREQALVAALRAWSEVEYDDEARKERLREAARLAESALGDVALAADTLEKILANDPADAAALDDLVRIRMAEGRWRDVAELLERRIDVESDPDARAALRRQLAHAYQGPLADPARAIEGWRAVLDEVPTDLDAIGALEQLYEAANRNADLEELVQRRLDIAETPADRIAARVRLARLAERSGRRSDAIEQLLEIVGEDPRNAEALDELERLYRADGRSAELVELLERRAGDAAADGRSAAELDALVRLASVHERELGDPAAAISIHERVLERDSQNRGALEAVSRLEEARGRFAEAADAIERLVQALPPAEAIPECFRLAGICEVKLADVPRAERALRAAFDLDRSNTDTRARLKAFFEKQGDHAALAEMLALDEADLVATDAKSKEAKVALLKRIADLYSSKLGDPASAASYLERATQLDPEDRNALLPLCDLYIAAGRQSDAIPVLEKIIASYGTRRSKEVAQYHHRLGQALEGMGNTQGALAAYDSAFKIDLTSVAILRDLGRLCYQSADFDRAQKTFRALLLQKLDGNAGITKGDVYYYLGDIEAKKGDAKKAISMLERAIAEQSDHAQARSLLTSLKS